VISQLLYRFPGEEIRKKFGKFVSFDPFLHREGFVIADHSGVNSWIFQEREQDEKAEFHFRSVVPVTLEQSEYLDLSNSFLTELREQHVGKAVFSRIESSDLPERFSIENFFHEMEKSYPTAFVYLISDPVFGTWVGATPEILLKSDRDQALIMSLAGTQPKSSQEKWGVKELAEQEMVTDFVMDVLKELNADQVQVNGPYTAEAGFVRHLRTDILFSMDAISPFDLIHKLHPTPAVSGLPRDKALDLIKKYEPQDRSLYTGYLGWFSAERIELYVNLRCCEIQHGKVYLYLGGGFTKDSIPDLEWEETVNKGRTIRSVLESC
jgi:isochorismate synthase